AWREERRIGLVVLTSDRGLCGAFNASLLRHAETFLRERQDREVQLMVVGRKGLDYYRRRRVTPLLPRTGVIATTVGETARELAERVTPPFPPDPTHAL